jgi:hypothetical protein
MRGSLTIHAYSKYDRTLTRLTCRNEVQTTCLLIKVNELIKTLSCMLKLETYPYKEATVKVDSNAWGRSSTSFCGDFTTTLVDESEEDSMGLGR